MKSTAELQHARTSNERNKVALQVKCSWSATCPRSTQRIPTACILQSKLLEPAVVKSVHACRRIFLSFSVVSFFSFCSTCKRFISVYSTTPFPSSPGFMRMNWAHLLSGFFFVCFPPMGAIHKMAATLGDSPTARALRGNFSSQRSLPHLAKHFSLGFLLLLRGKKASYQQKSFRLDTLFSSQCWFLLSQD